MRNGAAHPAEMLQAGGKGLLLLTLSTLTSRFYHGLAPAGLPAVRRS